MEFKVSGLVVAVVVAVSTAASAETSPTQRPWHVSIVGGTVQSGRYAMAQSGEAHMRGDFALAGYRDFDLVVRARGRAERERGHLVGLQAGYTFMETPLGMPLVVELEGLHIGARHHAALANPHADGVGGMGPSPLGDATSVVESKYAAGKHRFANTLHLDANIAMANVLASHPLHATLHAYAGVGIGVASLRASRARSYQTSPGDPIEVSPVTGEVVNHLNGRDHASDTVLAWQARIGLRANVTPRLSAFVEYRRIGIQPSRFVFGGTRYAGHAPTEHWRVANGLMRQDAALMGARYAL